MKKNALRATLLLLVVGVGVLLSFVIHPQQPISSPPQEEDRLSFSYTGSERVALPSAEGVQIDIVFPVFSSPSISEQFRTDAYRRAQAFLDENRELLSDTELVSELSLLSISGEYEIVQSVDALTVIVSTYTYTGGAHGMTGRTTYSFTLEGAPITLDTLFTDPQKAIEAIAQYAREQREQTEFNTDLWLEGLAPTREAYSRFVIHDEELEFLFDQYEIAPYSSGLQSIRIPRSIYETFLRF